MRTPPDRPPRSQATPRGKGATKRSLNMNALTLRTMAERLTKTTGIPHVIEYRFHSTRRWRFDLAFPVARVALEVDGGVYTQGRHIRPAGFIGDREKGNEAAILGWRVLHADWKMVQNGTAHDLLVRCITR